MKSIAQQRLDIYLASKLKNKKKIEDIPFEEYLRKLEKIVHQLEEGELTLDESVKTYEEGMNISKICLEKLNKTKKKIEHNKYNLTNFNSTLWTKLRQTMTTNLEKYNDTEATIYFSR